MCRERGFEYVEVMTDEGACITGRGRQRWLRQQNFGGVVLPDRQRPTPPSKADAASQTDIQVPAGGGGRRQGGSPVNKVLRAAVGCEWFCMFICTFISPTPRAAEDGWRAAPRI